MYVIYGLQDPRDNAVFYVGMTADVYRRFISHLKCEDNNEEKNKRIDGMKAQGFVPVLLTLETAHTQEVACKRETYWIQHFAHLGVPLTNISQMSKMKRQNRIPRKSTLPNGYKPSGRLSKENEQLVRTMLVQYPNAGTREIARYAGISPASAWRCLKRIRDEEAV